MTADPDWTLRLADVSWSFMIQVGVECLAFLVVVVFCLTCLRRGLWAWVGLLAGTAGAVANGIWAAVYGQIKFFDRSSISEAVFSIGPVTSLGRPDVPEILDWVRVAAIMVLAIAFVMGRRPRPSKKAIAIYETGNDAT